jgi:tetratricopeptide (TPR) repeat protein
MLKTIMGRAFLAALGLAVSALLFRTQIADALIVRGDDMLIQNAYDAAGNRYLRALWLDRGSVVAIDRLVFVALQERTPGALRSAATLASGYLGTHRPEQTVLFDRALCYLKLRRYAWAYADFLRAARLSGDPQQYTFAGWAARRAGDAKLAAASWSYALHIRPGYRPAAVALSELRQR